MFYATPVGDATHPGPYTLVRLLNGRGGGRLKGDDHASHDADVTLVTELELLESAVHNFKDSCNAQSKQERMGASASFSHKKKKRIGRRVCALFSAAISLFANVSCYTAPLQDVFDAGRWVESAFNLQDSSMACTLAVYY